MNKGIDEAAKKPQIFTVKYIKGCKTGLQKGEGAQLLPCAWLQSVASIHCLIMTKMLLLLRNILAHQIFFLLMCMF